MVKHCQLFLLLLQWVSTAFSISFDSTAWVTTTRVDSSRVLSVSSTYKGCVDTTLLEVAVDVYFVDLEDAMNITGWASIEEACYGLCLNKEAFSEVLSLAAPRANATYACGCHMAEELQEVETVGDEVCQQQGEEGGGGTALYCGPADRDCYNSAPYTKGGATLLLMAVLAALGTWQTK